MTDNITITRKGNILTITVDLDKQYGPSSSGKTTIIASSEGNASVPGSDKQKLGLNIFEKK
jgi:hypothetical protein